MAELSFKNVSPRVDSARWTHPSAIWALKECLSLQVYVGRPSPGEPLQWKAVLDRSVDANTPEWIERLASRGAVSFTDPDLTLLFPGQHFGSLSEVKAALALACEQAPQAGALGGLIA